MGSTIALPIRSFDRTHRKYLFRFVISAEVKRFLSQSLWDLLSGLAIAVIVHSLDPSLSTQLIVRLIPAYGFGASRLSVQPNVVRLYKVELREMV